MKSKKTIYIFQDLKVNKRNIKSIMVLFLFRSSNLFATKNIFMRIIGLPIRIFYKLIVEWFMCIEIPERLSIGKNIKLFHGQGLVINATCKIGNNVTLRHNITIGNSYDKSKCPIIGDNVNIGSNCVIIGPITIGNNVTIGAGSVVIKDIPNNAVVVGSPAKVIKIKNDYTS